MKFSRFVIAALLTAFLSIASASAQYVRPTTGGTMREFNFNNPMSALAATMVMNKAREDALAKRLGVRPGSAQGSANRASSQPQSQPVKPVDESSLRFRSAGGYIKTRELADQLGNDPTQRDQYFKLMNAVLDGFGQKVAAAGLQNDVAIALSYFFGENIRIYRGLPELSDQQYVNLRNMIANAITASGGLGNATDRQKQEMYETLVAYTGLTQFSFEQARQANNDQLTQLAQKLAGQNLQTVTKVSPDSINLTGDGLTVSGGTNDPATPTQPGADVVNTAGAPLGAQERKPIYQINCGGPAVGSFAKDAYFEGGSIFDVSTVVGIDAGDVAQAPPTQVLRSQRYGNFLYAFPRLMPNTPYLVRLHFAEMYFNNQQVGKRVFNVSINRKVALDHFDILVAAGGRNRAIVKEFNVEADKDLEALGWTGYGYSGSVTIPFTFGKGHFRGNALLSFFVKRVSKKQ